MPTCKHCGTEISETATIWTGRNGSEWTDRNGSDICQDSETSWHEPMALNETA
jgi:hypothetical protein